MAIIKTEIRKIKNIILCDLKIPEYQRPYKWEKYHITQLLNDLWSHFINAKIYRLGSIIIYNTINKRKEIIDGQQRLISLSLLFRKLNEKLNIKESLPLLKEKITTLSKNNLIRNTELISEFLLNKNEKLPLFKKYILNQCELVYIELDSLDEAFQFFDSQNSRGKSLSPHDLLKAYHLREMKDELHSNIHHAVEQWENNTSPQHINLNKIISLILFRLREWRKFNSAELFNNTKIYVFKGVSKNAIFPYLSYSKEVNQIQQVIINGKGFFDYIQHYRNIYDGLFHSDFGIINKIDISSPKEPGKKIPLLTLLNRYDGHHRTGDQYIRMLFECVLMQYYDRFGEINIDIATQKIFQWAYKLRIEN